MCKRVRTKGSNAITQPGVNSDPIKVKWGNGFKIYQEGSMQVKPEILAMKVLGLTNCLAYLKYKITRYYTVCSY